MTRLGNSARAMYLFFVHFSAFKSTSRIDARQLLICVWKPHEGHIEQRLLHVYRNMHVYSHTHRYSRASPFGTVGSVMLVATTIRINDLTRTHQQPLFISIVESFHIDRSFLRYAESYFPWNSISLVIAFFIFIFLWNLFRKSILRTKYILPNES